LRSYVGNRTAAIALLGIVVSGVPVFKQMSSAIDLGLLTTALAAATIALTICVQLP